MDATDRIKRRFFIRYKQTRWQCFSPLREYGQFLFVLGCQRSGTTLLENIFDGDHRSIVFREDSRLTGHGHRLRLKPYRDAKDLLDRLRAPLIVAKPLVESQRANELLDSFPRSRAIWLVRHYRAVISSHLRKFAGQHEYLRRILDQPDDWRGEHVSDDVRRVVRRYFHPEMTRANAAALIWYARNHLFFDQCLETNPKTLVLQYESLVQDIDRVLGSISEFLQLDPPLATCGGLIHARSLAPRDMVQLDREIEGICETLHARLKQVTEANWRGSRSPIDSQTAVSPRHRGRRLANA